MKGEFISGMICEYVHTMKHNDILSKSAIHCAYILVFDFFWLLEQLDELSFLLDLPNTLDEATTSGAVTY